MAEDTGRPQDQGRRHSRKGAPPAESVALLARYRDAMRAELAGLLDDLARQAPAGLGLEGTRPLLELKDRAPRWELAIRLARELGAEVDPPTPASAGAGSAKPRARGRVDYG